MVIITTCQAENEAQAEHLPRVSKNQSSILTAKKLRKSLFSVKTQSTLVTRTNGKQATKSQEASKKVLVVFLEARHVHSLRLRGLEEQSTCTH